MLVVCYGKAWLLEIKKKFIVHPILCFQTGFKPSFNLSFSSLPSNACPPFFFCKNKRCKTRDFFRKKKINFNHLTFFYFTSFPTGFFSDKLINSLQGASCRSTLYCFWTKRMKAVCLKFIFVFWTWIIIYQPQWNMAVICRLIYLR